MKGLEAAAAAAAPARPKVAVPRKRKMYEIEASCFALPLQLSAAAAHVAGCRCNPEVSVASCCSSCCLSSLAWSSACKLLTAALRTAQAPQIEVRRSGRLQGDKPQYNEDDLFAKELGIDR